VNEKVFVQLAKGESTQEGYLVEKENPSGDQRGGFFADFVKMSQKTKYYDRYSV